jgi:hypothetical protein
MPAAINNAPATPIIILPPPFHRFHNRRHFSRGNLDNRIVCQWSAKPLFPSSNLGGTSKALRDLRLPASSTQIFYLQTFTQKIEENAELAYPSERHYTTEDFPQFVPDTFSS